MANFPQAVLDAQVDLQLTAGGAWTGITSYALQRDGSGPPITIKRGRPDISQSATPGSADMQWKNGDGRFSPRNPTGPYYGQLTRNTPVRVSVPDTAVYLRLEGDTASYASAPDAAGLHITGDIDLRLDVNLTGWYNGVLAAKWTPAQLCWQLQIHQDGTLGFLWSTTGSNAISANSSVPLPLGRGVVRVTLSVSTGTVTFYTAATGNADPGPFTQLGTTTVAGATSIFAGTAGISLGNLLPAQGVSGVNGQIFEFELRNGIGSTVVAHPVFSAATAGSATYTDGQSNVWTAAGTAEYSSRSYRFHGEASALPQSWDSTGNDVWTPVQAAGILRRIQAASTPVFSPIRRGVANLTGTLTPVAYWPCEDASGATQFGSGLTGGQPMTITGVPNLAASTIFAGSAALPTVANSTWTGKIPPVAAWSDIVVRFVFNELAASIPNGAVLMSVMTTGTIARVDLFYSKGGALGLKGYDSGGTLQFTLGPAAFSIDNTQSRLGISLRTTGVAGGSVMYQIEQYGIGASAAQGTSTTIVGTLGGAYAVVVNPAGAQLGACTIGHVTVQSLWDTIFDLENNHALDGSLTGPLRGWAGEPAGRRFARLCTENGIASRIYGYVDTTAPMGVQAVDTLAKLLQDCEEADHGMIYEPRQALALGYRTLASLLNQSAKVTLSYTAAHLGDGSTLLAPTDDDTYTVNDWSVTNSGGATVNAVLNDGSAMSISPPPVGVGDYSSSKTLNLYSDTQLSDQAGWMLHVSTNNEERYPLIPLNLARSALTSLFFTVQNVELGDYMAVTSWPVWIPPGTVKQIVTGCTEQIGGYFWTPQWLCVPESPYEVGLADDLVYGRADTDGSTVHANIGSGATSMQVDTTSASSPIWTTAAGDFPFDILVSGEQITVTNITGSSSPQTFTITRSVNGVVKAQTAGTDVRLYYPPIVSLI